MCACSALVAETGLGQRPGRFVEAAKRMLALELPVALEGPTLILLVSGDTAVPSHASAFQSRLHDAVDSTITRTAVVAASAGYQFEVRLGARARVVDGVGHAVYAPPPNAATGYIVAAPGRVPRLVRDLLPATDLAHVLREFRRVVPPLET